MRPSLIAIGVFALDRGTKYLIDTRLNPYESHPLIPGFFDLVRSHNSGIAFGLFAQSASQYRVAMLIVFSLTALLVLAWMLWRNRNTDAISNTAIALIFGGAAGNVFDRIQSGSVTDFLDFYAGSYHWYTFNLADTAISTGAGLLLLGILRGSALARKAGA